MQNQNQSPVIYETKYSADVTLHSGPNTPVQIAREIQSEYDRKQAFDEGLRARKQLLDERYNLAIANAAAERLSNQPPVASPKAKTNPIPCNHIVSQRYYIAYDTEWGVLIACQTTPGSLWTAFQLLNKKQTKTYDDVRNPSFNNLSKAEFDNILKSKPCFRDIQSAYNVTAQMRSIDDLINRMQLPLATVVF